MYNKPTKIYCIGFSKKILAKIIFFIRFSKRHPKLHTLTQARACTKKYL